MTINSQLNQLEKGIFENWFFKKLLLIIQNWFLVFIFVSCPKRPRSCFATGCMIFSNITHQPTLRKALPSTAPFFSEYALENLLPQESYLCPGITFDFIRQRKESRNSRGSLFKLSSA